jgi:uncharacterized protein (DUF2252 family)
MSSKTTRIPSPAKRGVTLVERRNLKMAGSAQAFVRGSTLQFYNWLEERGERAVPKGPSIWICGDCHTGNLGPVAGADGKIHIQIRDLDQTVIGNPNHDLIRLALSLASAARGSGLPGVTTAHMLEQMIIGYQRALKGRSAAITTGKHRRPSVRISSGRRRPVSARAPPRLSVLKSANRVFSSTWAALKEARDAAAKQKT